MKCDICGQETSGSIGGKNICPACDCGIPPQRTVFDDVMDAYEAAPLRRFTKEQLADELSKRDGVEEIEVPDGRKWRTTVTDEDGFGDEWGKGYGAARILVVKQ